ncbi:MAG: class I SAM-dependent methyltransferase [Methanimicrococcus sp.]|nr:class I SAM-dependent methyltransferase [Methanimicrococcus sp.]
MTVSKKDVEAWDNEYSHLKWGGAAEHSWILNRLPLGSLLLDTGSGEGRHLKKFCLKYPCIGIDLSKTALRRSLTFIESAAGVKTAGPDFSVPDHMAADVSMLPFRNAVFDGLLCLGVLQHLTAADRKKAADEFYKVLKPGGFLFFEVFGEADMRCKGDPYPAAAPEPRTFLRQNGIIYHYFEEGEIRELFESSGFSTIEIKSIKKEKKYGGEIYIRHHYRAVFEK